MPRIRFSSRRRRSEAILVALLCLFAPTPAAQNVTEAALKAAFIYNFAKFTEWPRAVLPGTTPFVMCVLGDAAVSDALERSARGRELGGHVIAVSRVTAGSPLTSCHILYVTGVSASQATQILTSLHAASVLTISDSGEFVGLGGMTQFFVEGGSMRFCINADSARIPRLQFSSKLLALARCPR
jgi:YfiR/HmsC-like